ncbi:hypothetical protein [Photorhabdus aegyptia]|uniref:Uncharacterized protein n=1 Tax=Photorhabdus aegyptia TaxID=2805098 RepID=A0A022PDH3_9GAMM|nr:hypothetical protein [Photorhabdus aegyptia]EYU14232.1 hypothetical protein BA1DRAFT_03228 [Photorhabdus aegyptia]KGM27565.1 hypothetical protein KS18_14040 [Photorhabdus luminescens]
MKSSINFISLVKEYTAATLNEISIDTYIVKGISKDVFPKIPRPQKWVSLWRKNKFSIYFFYMAAMFFLLSGGAFIYFIFAIVKLYFIDVDDKELLASKRSYIDKGFELDKIIVGFDYKTYQSAISFYKDTKLCWLSLPWTRFTGHLCHGHKKISIANFLSFKDYLSIFVLSSLSFFSLVLNRKTISHILQIYTAPKWFYVRLALSKVNGHFITTEHMDRWAILMDRLCLSKKTNLTLVQHGSLKALVLPENAHFKIYTRLHSVAELVAYDRIESEIFLDKIIRNGKGKAITLLHMGMQLNTVKVDNDKFSILFVGHPHCEDTQIKIYHSLVGLNIIAYYKEHPKAPASRNVRKIGWVFINDLKFFPSVDLVISYASTLAYEYESIGAKVLFHDLSTISESMCSNIVSLIKEEVKNNERK